MCLEKKWARGVLLRGHGEWRQRQRLQQQQRAMCMCGSCAAEWGRPPSSLEIGGFVGEGGVHDSGEVDAWQEELHGGPNVSDSLLKRGGIDGDEGGGNTRIQAFSCSLLACIEGGITTRTVGLKQIGREI